MQTVRMADNAERRTMNEAIIDEFRSHEGRVGGPFDGIPMLLLHTRGARSGAERVNPLAYLELEGRLYVFASNGGRAPNPGWYYNVLAEPHVTVEVGTRTSPAVASALAGAERDRVYAEQVARIPMYADYEKQVDRTIPVVALELVES